MFVVKRNGPFFSDGLTFKTLCFDCAILNISSVLAVKRNGPFHSDGLTFKRLPKNS